MRIALDGSFLQLPPSGTAAYINGLLSGFEELRSTPEVCLLSPRWGSATSDPDSAEPRREVSVGRKGRLIWELFGVAREAQNVDVELLHVPHFSAPVRAGMPFVVTIHDVIPLVLPEYRASAAMRTRLPIVKRTVRRARLILTPSKAAAADIREALHVPEVKLRVTPEAAGERYSPATDLPEAKRQVAALGITGPYIFNVGGLDVRKNLPALIEAFAGVRSRLPAHTQLVIAGAAHTANQVVFPPLEPVVAKFGLGESVRLLGRVSEEDKLKLYRAADLYVTPSLYEGFGLTALEAMACGAPTIAANRTSLPEVVGEGGLLVEPDATSIGRAIVEVLTNVELAESLRMKALHRAKDFTWQRTAELTVEAYREALAAGSKN